MSADSSGQANGAATGRDAASQVDDALAQSAESAQSGGGHAAAASADSIHSPTAPQRSKAARVLRGLARGLAWLLALFVALVLLALLVWRGAGWWLDWRGPTPAQQTALALINAPAHALPGPDGFADLWLMDKDVAADQRAAWLAQDVAWFQLQSLFAPMEGLPSNRLPKLPVKLFDEVSCKQTEPCLNKVGTRYEAVGQWAERQAPLLDRVEALASAGHWGQPFGDRLDAPLPHYAVLTQPYTRFAWRFVQAQRRRDAAQAKAGNLAASLAAAEQGEREQFAAMQGLCRHSAAMQRLLTQPGQNLLTQMLASADVRLSTSLLADMLAERADESPTPPECAQAFAPLDGQPPGLGVGTEASAAICHALRAEWKLLRSFEGLLPSAWPWQYEGDFGEWLMLALSKGHPGATGTLGAQARAAYCEPAYAQAFAKGDRAAMQTPEPQFDTLSCMASPMACSQLGDIAFTEYADRIHDREAMRRAMASLLYTRAMLEGGPTRTWLSSNAVRAGRRGRRACTCTAPMRSGLISRAACCASSSGTPNVASGSSCRCECLQGKSAWVCGRRSEITGGGCLILPDSLVLQLHVGRWR